MADGVRLGRHPLERRERKGMAISDLTIALRSGS